MTDIKSKEKILYKELSYQIQGAFFEVYKALRNAYKELFTGSGTFSERTSAVRDKYKNSDKVMEVVEFLLSDTARAICQPEA